MSADWIDSNNHVVIIGAGQAGFSVASRLRDKHKGAITLLGDENYLPYQRPPLSKGYLLGELDEQRLYFRAARYYKENNITLRLGISAQQIFPAQKRIQLSDDSSLCYSHLVLSTGARPRLLPDNIGKNLSGIYYVRTLSDIKRIKNQFQAGKRVLIVGGGYIGLEAAAVSTKLGLDVTLLEAAERILQRVACTETADYFRNLHITHGVHLYEGVALEQLTGKSGQLDTALLSNGTVLPVDFVIVGIGIVPNVELASTAGLFIDNGIVVNEYGQTHAPDIYAAGDCCAFLWQDKRIRLESVGNALEQGEVVARNLTGEAIKYRAKPWFWSDQFAVKLQIAGLSTGFEHIVARKEIERGLSHWYYRGETLLAVDAINAPSVYMVAKRLLEAGKSPAAEKVGNALVDLRSLL